MTKSEIAKEDLRRYIEDEARLRCELGDKRYDSVRATAEKDAQALAP